MAAKTIKATTFEFGKGDAGKCDVSADIFGQELRSDILHRVVNWQLAKRQAGTHQAKERGDVKGTNAKPFRQKGTGNARQGDRKVSQMRGGGKAGAIPRVRSHAHNLPKKLRKLGLKVALSSKCATGNLFVVKDAAQKKANTADLVKSLSFFKGQSVLFIDGAEIDANFKKSVANAKHVDVLPGQGANVYDILKRDNVVITETGVKYLEERLA